MFGLGVWELAIILIILLVIFGGRRLPEIGSGLGRAIKNFKSGITGKDEIDVTPGREDAERENSGDEKSQKRS